MRFAALAGLLLLTGCPGSGVPDDDDSAPSLEEAGQPLVCADVSPSVTPEGDGWLVSTARYTLHVRGVDEAEAARLGALAETAWAGWEAYFPTPPSADEPLVAWIEASFDDFRARLAADGLDPDDAGDAGGYYHPSTGAAYLYVQPTVWFTRVLLLHELAHQAHDRARAASGLPGWYVEGIAEYLSRHDWDGECLRLGVTPHLSLEDPAADALDAVVGVDLKAWFDDGAWPGRPLAMAWFRMVETDPALAGGWRGLREDIDADGEIDAAAVEGALGRDVDTLQDDLSAFLAGDQEPMVPVWLEWLHRTPDSVRGWADGVLTVARHKEPVGPFSFVSDAPETGAVGAVIAWDSGSDFTAVLLAPDGALWSFDAVAGTNTWNQAGSVDPPNGPVTWSVRHEGSDAIVTVDGAERAVPVLATPASGLAVEDDDVVFTDLSWSP